MSIPAEFQMPQKDQSGRLIVSPSEGGALRPIFGTVGSQFIKFWVHHEYNKSKSEEKRYEVLDDVEMVEVRSASDKYMVLHKRVSELSREQREQWAAIYDAFKRQVQALGTPIDSWIAIADRQKALLAHCNVLTVEQLASLNVQEVGRLGPEGPELKTKAEQHIKAKQVGKEANTSAELKELRDELESQAKKAKAKEEALYARLAALEAGRAPAVAIPAVPEIKRRRGRAPRTTNLGSMSTGPMATLDTNDEPVTG